MRYAFRYRIQRHGIRLSTLGFSLVVQVKERSFSRLLRLW